MKAKSLLKSLVILSLLVSSVLANDSTNLTKASAKVQSIINKFKLEIVDYNYTKAKIGKGTHNSAKAILVDARPNKKYKVGTIPSAINIPDTDYKEFVNQLKDTAKNKEIIVFCGGWNCGKSPKVANMLKKDGFTNVKLYQAGEPEWSKRNYKEVHLVVTKAAQANNSAVLIDARPYKMFLAETIAGAISIPDTKVEELKGRFPIHQNEKIIVFCGGYKCAKSHKVANKLISMGYRDVNVFAGGLPKWKKAGLSTTKSAGEATSKKASAKPMISENGAKLGLDEGSIDGEWLNGFIKENKVPDFIQIVDVTDPSEFKNGHIKGAINIPAEKLSAKQLYAKLPKGKTIVFNCTAGGRSIEAWTKLKEAKFDVSEIFYFDANVDCKGTKCKIEVNEALGI
ncbi:sulfurtransferase [Arcobacter sp. CECT 8983]|uniref:rhodanese-like domain-containing protein n=1 Tax=Arcobacter sp. CECT 8983 TaxID=2044508 RepID=UPI00100C0F8D|nr:rhodanese-like domain-containing protein [Arcobacter sp. CECT 8983]RXJ91825.1 sulfurtransferase [Arcobacter sp. CECT 8983]